MECGHSHPPQWAKAEYGNPTEDFCPNCTVGTEHEVVA